MSASPFDDDYVHNPLAGYVILSGGYVDLPLRIKDHLDRGWLPQGGVAIAGPPGEMRFYQAMIHPRSIRTE